MIVPGKIVRSGYAPHGVEAMQRYGQRYAAVQSSLGYQSAGGLQPIIEVDGKLRSHCRASRSFRRWGTARF